LRGMVDGLTALVCEVDGLSESLIKHGEATFNEKKWSAAAQKRSGSARSNYAGIKMKPTP